MARQEFTAAAPGMGLMRSITWGVINGIIALCGIVWLIMGLAKTGGKDIFVGLTWIVVGGVNLVSWYRLRQPLVIIEDDAVVWRSGMRMRRHALADLALSPDPFDVTVLRLQTRGGRFLRLPRDGVAKAAELEGLLQARLQRKESAVSTPAPADTTSDPTAGPAS